MRRLFFILFAVVIAATATAVPAYKGPILRTMEDGSEQVVYLHSKEHFQHQQAIGDKPFLVPRVLVLLVNFADTKFTTPKDTIDSLLNGANFSRSYIQKAALPGGGTTYVHINSNGSARKYFQDQSYGQYAPVFDVFGPVELSKNASYYGQNDEDSKDTHAYEMIRDACDKADADGLDFRQYDSDNDGYVDAVYAIYAGYGEADGGPDSTIWPHQWNVSSYKYRHDGKYIGKYACSSELSYISKLYAGIGTLCHEFSHVLGLPDLYETNKERLGLHTLCEWDIMDQGSYNNGGNTPPAYSAYERFYMGWLTPRVLTEPEEVTLHPINEGQGESLLISETDNHNLVGWDPNPTTYYLLEDRKKEGWDQHLPGNGMLITRIRFNRSMWKSNKINCAEETMGVDILEAKTNATNSGKSSDAFPAGTVKQWTELAGHEITNITRSSSNGIIRFSYRGEAPEGIEDVQRSDVRGTKVLRNGQLYILYEGQMYDVQGRRVKE